MKKQSKLINFLNHFFNRGERTMKALILSTFVVIFAISVSTVFSEDFTLDATGVVSVNQYYDAVWSPDGNYIAVTAAGNPEAEKGQVDVLLVPVDGSKPVNLTGDIDDWCRNQKFTFDSSEVAFTRLFIGDERITGENIEAVNIKTGEHRVVMEDALNPAFSNDGRYLAFIRYYDLTKNGISGSKPKIVLYDLLEKEATDLFKFTYAVPPSIHFSPDNTHIITAITSVDSEILSEQGKRNGIVLIPLDGSDPELIHTNSYHINFPTYSPDGKWIVYTQYEHDLTLKPTRENNWGITSIDIVLYETDTGHSMKLSEYFEVYNSDASFSPDGSQICYTLDFGEDGLIYISRFLDYGGG